MALATCLGIAGITDYRAVFADGPVTGLVVLVHGATGGVGSVAVQMARRDGVHRIADVDFATHIDLDAAVIAVGGVICSFASSADRPSIPYWTLGFADTTLRLHGSDDFAPGVKADAAAALTAALVEASGSRLSRPLDDIALAHELVEQGAPGRVIVELRPAG